MYSTPTNCLSRGLQFARRLPLTIRVGEKNATYDTMHRYSYLTGLLIFLDFPRFDGVAM